MYRYFTLKNRDTGRIVASGDIFSATGDTYTVSNFGLPPGTSWSELEFRATTHLKGKSTSLGGVVNAGRSNPGTGIRTLEIR